MATNLPLGTYVQDGLRSGPFYTGQVPASLLTFNPTEVLSYSSYNTYGPGVLYSPQNTWNIIPNITTGAGFTILNNLVANTVQADLTAAAYLTLRGDNNVTAYIGGAIPYVQFDWPRIVTVTLTGTNALNAQRRVTIFGYDWYGIPLQHTYLVQALGTYPVITLGDGANLSVPAKAFYTVTAVYINGGITNAANDAAISLGAADVFGLPYVANDRGNITSVGWAATSEETVFTLGSNLTFLGIFVGADLTSPPTSITGDVRGLYGTSTAANGASRLRFTYYVSGADMWTNQVANAQSLATANNQTVVGVAASSLTAADLYGFPQYYTGSPS